VKKEKKACVLTVCFELFLDIKEEPYLLKEEGWGEFDLRIMLHFVDDFAPREIIVFDLNFKEPRYFKLHPVVSKSEGKDDLISDVSWSK
jgi:transcription initiation factor IIF auxiliary subunit